MTDTRVDVVNYRQRGQQGLVIFNHFLGTFVPDLMPRLKNEVLQVFDNIAKSLAVYTNARSTFHLHDEEALGLLMVCKCSRFVEVVQQFCGP